MSNLTTAEITRLSEVRSHPCVSIHLPLHPDTEERRHDPILFKNLLREAGLKMAAMGIGSSEIDQVLAPGFARVQDPLDWTHGGRGLAWFGSPGHHQALDLDFPVEQQLTIGRRYALKPLLWHFQLSKPFYVLTVSKHGARLLGCTAEDQAEIELPDVPAGLPGIRELEEHQEHVGVHPSAKGHHRASGRNTMVMHGHGDRKEEQRDLEQFVAALAQAVEKHTEPGRPVVLAGAEEMVAMYRHAHRARSILADGWIKGNQDEADASALRRQGWEIVEPLFALEREEALERLNQSQGMGMPSTVEVAELVPAAFSGRVDTLLLPANLCVPGRFDRDTLAVTTEDGEDSEDLLELAARHTLDKGGKVYLFENGSLQRAGALLRW